MPFSRLPYVAHGPPTGEHGPLNTPNQTVATSSSSQPAPVIEQTPDQERLKPTSLLLDPQTRPRSVAEASFHSDTSTLVESWSAPTYAESTAGSARCAESSLGRGHVAYIIEVLQSSSHAASNEKVTKKEVTASKERSDVDTRVAIPGPTRGRSEPEPWRISALVDALRFNHDLKILATHDPMERFLAVDKDDAPWSVHHLRLPGTICAICGLSFTNSGHRESVVEHIRREHSRSEENTFPPNKHAEKKTYFHRLPKLSDGATDHTIRESVSRCKASAKSTSWSKGHLLKDEADLQAIGSRWDDEPPMGKLENKAVPSIQTAVQPRLIQCDNSQVPHDRLLFLLNSLDPTVYPQRPNNFFNGLNMIASNLIDRFPNDVVAQGTQRALARLERLYALNFGGSLTDVNQWTSAWTRNGSNVRGTGQSDVDASSSASTYAPSFGSQKSFLRKEGGSSRSGGKSGSQAPKNGLARETQYIKSNVKNRLLACPVRKHREAHEEACSCNFGGASNMSSLTQHLNSRAHRQMLPTLRLCRICWAYTVSDAEYHSLHSPGICQRIPQPRNNKVAGYWLDLYGKIFPLSNWIPSPYVGESTKRPKIRTEEPNDSISLGADAHLTLDFNDTAINQSFLDHHLPAVRNSPPSVDNGDVRPEGITIDDAETTAIELFCLILSERARYGFDLSDQYMADFMARASHMAPGDLNGLSDRLHTTIDAMMLQLRTQAPLVGSQSVGAPHPGILTNTQGTYNPYGLHIGGFLSNSFSVAQPSFETFGSDHMLPPQAPDFSESSPDYDPIAFPFMSSDPNLRSFLPDFNFAMDVRPAGLASREGSLPAIVA